MSEDEYAPNEAWDLHSQVNEIPVMDDDEALALFRTTPFLHVGAKPK